MVFYPVQGSLIGFMALLKETLIGGLFQRVFFKSEPRAAFWRPVVPVVSPGPLSGQHSPVNKGGDRQCRPSNGENPRVVRAGRHGGGAMGLPDAESV